MKTVGVDVAYQMVLYESRTVSGNVSPTVNGTYDTTVHVGGHQPPARLLSFIGVAVSPASSDVQAAADRGYVAGFMLSTWTREIAIGRKP